MRENNWRQWDSTGGSGEDANENKRNFQVELRPISPGAKGILHLETMELDKLNESLKCEEKKPTIPLTAWKLTIS